MSLAELVEVSRRVGADPEWVLAGGGNASFKDHAHLYIKASGHALATIDEEGFARMDRSKLAAIWEKQYPSEVDAREAAALADLLAARIPGEDRRPSVETLMHELFPYAFVVHTHPAIVNGLTCSREAQTAAAQLFGDRVLWVPAMNPGYVLAIHMREAAKRYHEAHGNYPQIVMMQNHGLVVAADTTAEIDEIHEHLLSVLRSSIGRAPDANGIYPDDQQAKNRAESAIGQALPQGTAVRFVVNNEIRRFVATEDSFSGLREPFTPDHIVYSGPQLLYAGGCADDAECARAIAEGVAAYVERHSVVPKVIAVAGVGCFCTGPNDKAARAAELLLLDAVKIATYTEAFGGPSPLPAAEIAFIMGWEVERFRARLSTDS